MHSTWNNELYHTKLRNKDTGTKLRGILDKLASATNDFPYDNQPHQNIIDPDLYAIKYDPELDD